jgi:hypothetical protein
MTPKALRSELGWSRSTMDRCLRVIGGLRTSRKGPGPWVLTRAEVDLLRAAHGAGVAPKGLAQLARARAGARLKQSEASICVTGIADRGTVQVMDLHEMFGKAGAHFHDQKAGLSELKRQADENRLALAELAGGSIGKAMASESLRRFERLDAFKDFSKAGLL